MAIEGQTGESLEELVRSVCGTLKLEHLSLRIIGKGPTSERQAGLLDLLHQSSCLSQRLAKLELELPGFWGGP
jgi:hypothetical protein